MKMFARILFCLCMLTGARAAEPDRQTDLTKALAKAKAENRMMLLNFTGDSSWCGDCKNLDAEVFKDAAFQHYARSNFVLVELKEANEALEKKYDVYAWPTLVLLNTKGNVLHKKIGYRKGEGVRAVIEEIESRRN